MNGNLFTLVNDYKDMENEFDFIINVSRSKDNYFNDHDYNENNLLGKELSVEPENHPKDPNAIKVSINKKEHLGYIQTGLTNSFKSWIDSGRISDMKITKVNGSEVTPNVYAYVKINKK